MASTTSTQRRRRSSTLPPVTPAARGTIDDPLAVRGEKTKVDWEGEVEIWLSKQPQWIQGMGKDNLTGCG